MSAYSQGCLSFEFDPQTKEVYRTLDFMGLIGERVSTNGDVFSRKRRGRKRGTLTDTWKTRKLAPLHKGYSYSYISFKVQGKSETYPVHLLVLLAFMGPFQKGMRCRHLNVQHVNGVRNDNRIENLCVGTQNGKNWKSWPTSMAFHFQHYTLAFTILAGHWRRPLTLRWGIKEGRGKERSEAGRKSILLRTF